MSLALADRFGEDVRRLDPASPQFVADFVALTLSRALEAGASDVHWQPTADGLNVRVRIDGVLHSVGTWPRTIAPNVVARLKVLADLLTYRTDAPQEGRLRPEQTVKPTATAEMRLSTFPTLFGEKAVVRIFASAGRLLYLADLGLPEEVEATLSQQLDETSGAVLATGPAGSGKTTTIYACLRELVARTKGQRNLTSLEDPIETAVDGISQSAVNPAAGFTLAAGLRSLMRQDPEVIMVGEIRDAETAAIAFQAVLTGHLLLATFHAGSAAGAVSRLSDMGVEPYLLRSGVLGILGQRLVRRLCECARESTNPDDQLGLKTTRCRVPVGCPACAKTGYRGRAILAEMLTPKADELGRAILSRGDARELETLAVQAGMVTRWQRARQAVEAGWTSPAEIRRVLGFSTMP